jgi:hypothetical protein
MKHALVVEIHALIPTSRVGVNYLTIRDTYNIQVA